MPDLIHFSRSHEPLSEIIFLAPPHHTSKAAPHNCQKRVKKSISQSGFSSFSPNPSSILDFPFPLLPLLRPTITEREKVLHHDYQNISEHEPNSKSPLNIVWKRHIRFAVVTTSFPLGEQAEWREKAREKEDDGILFMHRLWKEAGKAYMDMGSNSKIHPTVLWQQALTHGWNDIDFESIDLLHPPPLPAYGRRKWQ